MTDTEFQAETIRRYNALRDFVIGLARDAEYAADMEPQQMSSDADWEYMLPRWPERDGHA